MGSNLLQTQGSTERLPPDEAGLDLVTLPRPCMCSLLCWSMGHRTRRRRAARLNVMLLVHRSTVGPIGSAWVRWICAHPTAVVAEHNLREEIADRIGPVSDNSRQSACLERNEWKDPAHTNLCFISVFLGPTQRTTSKQNTPSHCNMQTADIVEPRAACLCQAYSLHWRKTANHADLRPNKFLPVETSCGDCKVFFFVLVLSVLTWAA